MIRGACQSLSDTSSQSYWDDVFTCLNIDVNSTIDLANLKMPEHPSDVWLNDHKATLNSLEVILGLMLLCGQIFYFLLLMYLLLFAVGFIRLFAFDFLKKCYLKMRFALKNYKSEKQKVRLMNCRPSE